MKPDPGPRVVPRAPAAAAGVFGGRLELAERYAAMLAGGGVERGVIGPHEAERLWDRHLLNSAVLGELVGQDCRVLDVGSGAGLPGIPLALARPDLAVTLLEPMARRVSFLEEVVAELGLPVQVCRGRAEQPVHGLGAGWDVVTARAVAPLGRLAGWCLPLVRIGGRLLAVKGASAEDEAARDAREVGRAGGDSPTVVRCGEAVVQPPTTVVVIGRRGGTRAPRRTRKDR